MFVFLSASEVDERRFHTRTSPKSKISSSVDGFCAWLVPCESQIAFCTQCRDFFEMVGLVICQSAQHLPLFGSTCCRTHLGEILTRKWNFEALQCWNGTHLVGYKVFFFPNPRHDRVHCGVPWLLFLAQMCASIRFLSHVSV